MNFKSIEEVLSSDFGLLSDGYEEKKKTDRVLKSTKIEQAIFDDLSSDCAELPDYEKKGMEKLKTFDSLINDVFQSVYGLTPKYTTDEDMSALSKSFNKGILEDLMSDDNYSAIKSVCEGKELPAIGATEEFTANLLGNLDSIMNKTTGGKGKVDALGTMEEAKQELLNQISELLKKREALPETQREAIERKIVNKANNFLSKNEQIQMYASLIESGMKQNGSSIKNAVSMSISAALERANEVRSAVLAWGNGDAQMQKNPVNTEILKRTSKSHKLRYIARFLGRYKEMLNSKRLAGYTYGRGEKYDIEYGNNISKALTSEMAMLSTPELMPLFLRKYQHKALKQYRKREPEYKGKGDIIVCLDESGSTFGENNAYGMAVAMVLYQLCRINKSNFALVHFSSETKTDFFPKDEEISSQRILDCAETFLNGGTDFEKPLREAFALTSSEKMDKPDIVFITDGICDVSDAFLDLLEEFKADTGAKLTGILLDEGESFDFSLKKFADKVYRTSELLKDEIVDDIISDRL